MRSAGTLIGLLVVVIVIANLVVGSGSSDQMVNAARSRCIADGFAVQTMSVTRVEMDSGIFGIGGRGSVEFTPVGMDPARPKPLHVELRREMNFLEWKAVQVAEGTKE